MEKYTVFTAKIRRTVQKGMPIAFTFPVFDDDMERKLMISLESILDRYNHQRIREAIWFSVFELVSNAITVNVRSLFFEERGWNLLDDENLSQRLKVFHAAVLACGLSSLYVSKLKEAGFFVSIRLTHQDDYLRIEVANNVPLTPKDQLRIRRKFLLAKKYKKLTEWHENRPGRSTDEGFRFVSMLLTLKKARIDPSSLLIDSRKQGTRARLTVPFEGV